MKLLTAGFFVARTPLLVADAYSGQPLETALSDPIVREAIDRASPSLTQALDKPGHPQRARNAALRYLARMRGRSTPFSLMAGYSHGPVGGPNAVVRLSPRHRAKRIVRLDADCVAGIVHAAAHDSKARAGRRWRARCDLIVLPDLIRVAVRDMKNPEEARLLDVVRSAALDRVLAMAERPVSFPALIDGLRPFARSAEESADYIHALIDQGLLVPENHPSLAAEDELAVLLDDHPELVRAARAMRAVELGVSIDEPIRMLQKEIETARESFSANDLIFDVVKPLDSGSIGDEVARAVVTIVRVLQRILPRGRDQRLSDFARVFLERYEGREVPLVEALDSNRGYDFPMMLTPGAPDDRLAAWTAALLERAWRTGAREMILEETDLPAAELWQPEEVISVLFKLAYEPLSIWEPTVVSTPGTMAFGRATAFCPDLKTSVRNMLDRVRHRDATADLAQVVHFLPGKFAALGQLPRFLPYELSLSACPADAESAVTVNDLVVSCSIAGDFVLRSRKTGRRVIPRHVGAANLDRPDNTSLGRFVGALARLDGAGGRWEWPERRSRFRPRICVGPHVLSPAEWTLGKAQTSALCAARSASERSAAVERLREELSLPREVVYREQHDYWLPIDLEDPGSVEAWLDIASDEMLLAEQFPVERSAVRGPEGPYHHELVLPFLVEAGAPPASPQTPPPVQPSEIMFDRVLPGGETLYLTITGDRSELFEILSELYAEVVQPQMQRGQLRNWFFLPYTASLPHIRLRLFGPAGILYGQSLPAIHERLDVYLRNRVIQSVAIDTYDRETYRYGGFLGMELCEQIFRVSSEYALEFHGSLAIDVAEVDELIGPWVDSLREILVASGLPYERRREIARLAVQASHRPDTPAMSAQALPKHQAGDLYRKIKRGRWDVPAVSSEFGAGRIDQLTRLFAQLRDGVASGKITRDIEPLLIDLLHVHSIRLLTTWNPHPRIEEIGYHVLGRVLAAEAYAT